MVGDDGDAFLGIAAVVDEDAGEHAAGLPLADADRQVLVELGEAAGLQDVGQHVGGDLGVPLLHAAHAVGREIGGDEGDQQRHHAGGVEERAEQPERREAGGIHHDDFGIGRELVQGVRDRDHQRDRRDDQHQRRNHQAGDAEKGQDGLALARHQVDAAQRLRNPDHAGQADQNQRKRRERRAENIPVDRPHRYRTIPTLARPNERLATNPGYGIPIGRAACRPAGYSLTTIPLIRQQNGWAMAPSRIWLIIRVMWPSGHGGAWQRGGSTGHSAGNRAVLKRFGPLPMRTFQIPGPRPGDS